MGIKKYSRLISFLLFIEYGLYLSLVGSIYANMLPNDEYAPLVRGIVYGLLFHALMCVLVATFTGILIKKRLQFDTVASSLHAMLVALAALPFGMLVGAALLFLTAFYPLTGNAERLAQIMVAIGYLTGLILPSFLSFQHLQKQQSLTAK